MSEIKGVGDDERDAVTAFWSLFALSAINVSIPSASSKDTIAAITGGMEIKVQNNIGNLLEKWTNDIKEQAKRIEEDAKSPTEITKKSLHLGSAVIASQNPETLSQNPAVQTQVSSAVSTIASTGAGVGTTFDEVVGVVSKDTSFPIPLHNQVVQIDDPAKAALIILTIGMFVQAARIQGAAAVSVGGGSQDAKVKDLQYALAYAKNLLLQLGSNVFVQATNLARMKARTSQTTSQTNPIRASSKGSI